MKGKLFLIVIIVFSGLFATVFADTVTVDITQFTTTGTIETEDYNFHGWGDVNKLDGFLDYVSWTHYFAIPSGSIVSATLEITFADDDRDHFCWIFPIDHEWALGFAEDWSFDFGEIDSGVVGPYSLNVSYLEDGNFWVKVLSTGGDFDIVDSKLTITSRAVPEPATFLLLCFSIIGLGAARKHR